jgi:alkylhydroperoxidase/carboxymuconolactone decarboxylase family protein YurZ
MTEEGAPVLEALVEMNEGNPERSGLDPEKYMLVRIAALASVGAPPASYLLNLGAASELGVSLEDVQGTLIAIAPVIGSARVASAGSAIARGLGLAIAIAEEAELEENE